MTAEPTADPAAVVARLQQRYGGRLDFAFGAYSGRYYAVGIFGIATVPDPGALAALAEEYAAAIERWHAAPPPRAVPVAPRAGPFTVPVRGPAAVP
ncbi:hypothetical protein ACFPZ0_20690 [Streptomonospora nanhaiensis]|uniref:Uncharacterized protein n=1 Tax=Streptomonospora nanhaiensis TaxID=1323731 RepID=A0A853BNJ6_9ACTN|nr:hypothetical protein [Streptomonospora nanhaiensis]MBV2361895.1 hypothetical protein [Streptomonospora nanhaiensis]MBX9390531.1 hypothetical protein [Streptomonospora nanhaiensis]NYI96285.1 hypothetical protein [Streptomonospora nanhaiensis]